MKDFVDWVDAQVEEDGVTGNIIGSLVFMVIATLAVVGFAILIAAFIISVPLGLLLVFGVPSAYVVYKYKSRGE